MTEQITLAPNDKKLEFLRDVLEAAEKRRDAVENKSSIILATNAILLTAIASLGLSAIYTSSPSNWSWLRYGLAFVVLGAVAVSSLCAILVLAPISSQQRTRLMKLPPNEFNVFFSGKISEYEDARAYLDVIEALTGAQIVEQLAVQAYNLSRIVVHRYKWFHRSQSALLLGYMFSV